MIESDIENLIELEMSSFNHTLGKEFFLKALNNSFSYFYVYLENDNILGYISSLFDGEIIEILNFCVKEEYRRLKVGSKLLNYLLTNLYYLKANSAILEVRESNNVAINLYKSFGFKHINTRKNYYNDLENALVLQKIFTPFDDILKSYYESVSDLNDNKYFILNNQKLINKLIKKENIEIETNLELLDCKNDKLKRIYYSNIKGINLNISYNDIDIINDNNKLIELNTSMGIIKAFVFYDNLYIFDINIDYKNDNLILESLIMKLVNYVKELNIYNVYISSTENSLNNILEKWGLNMVKTYHVYNN